MAPASWNIGLFVADLLVDQHGFEQLDAPSHFLKKVDGQHAALVSMSPWDREPPGGHDRPSVYFGVARRDINELWRDLIRETIDPWKATTNVSFSADDPSLGSLSYLTTSRDDVAEFVDEWIPKMLAERTNLASVEAELTRRRRRTTVANGLMKGDPTVFPRMMNALLDGWTEEEEAEFMGELQGRHDFLNPEPRARVAAQMERVRAWVAEHPDGVERELTGR